MNSGKHDWKSKQPIMKLKCIVDYSFKMRAVDQTNMLLCYVWNLQLTYRKIKIRTTEENDEYDVNF